MVSVPHVVTDPQWDWSVPVTDGSTVQVGDRILWSIGQPVTLDTVTVNEDGSVTFTDAGTFNATLSEADLARSALGFRVTLFRVTPKPVVKDLFVGSDGSRWIYPGDITRTLFCWRAGSQFKQGARYLPGDLLRIITITPE